MGLDFSKPPLDWLWSQNGNLPRGLEQVGYPRWQQTQQTFQEHRAALSSGDPGPRLQTELRKGWLTCFLSHCIRCYGCSAVLHTQSSGHQHSPCNCYWVLRDIQALYVRHDQKSFPAITSQLKAFKISSNLRGHLNLSAFHFPPNSLWSWSDNTYLKLTDRQIVGCIAIHYLSIQDLGNQIIQCLLKVFISQSCQYFLNPNTVFAFLSWKNVLIDLFSHFQAMM